MTVSVVNDIEKYLRNLYEVIYINKMIEDPKAIKSLVQISKNAKGEIIGWEITDKEVKFTTGDYLDCDEGAIKNGDKFIIGYFSYHFQPNGTPKLLIFRVDLEQGDLHLNPDQSLEPRLKHRIPPNESLIDITNFNCLLAIHLGLQYIRNEIYPADDNHGVYNKILEGLRRQVS